MGDWANNFPFLRLAFLRSSGRDLRLEVMAHCQSGILRIRRLNKDLGGTLKILCRGSA
jgi:hypothetical protein